MKENERTSMADGSTSGAKWASREYPYDRWMEAQGIPVHTGYYIPDLRTLEVEWWQERQCRSAFVQLVGNEGVVSGRVTEIAPGASLPPLKFALDEVVYVCSGRGTSAVWASERSPRRTFEWQEHSLFLVPRHHCRVFSNVQGDRPVRLFHFSYMALAMSALPDPDLYFHYSYEPSQEESNEDLYSEAKLVQVENGDEMILLRAFWSGNFFPDMRAWTKLDPNSRRGAGGKTVFIRFPGTEIRAHMSVFPAQTYKKAHRHGPGRAILIPAGEGYSVMWEEGKEKVVCPWQECSMVTPPNRWFHQHFNVGDDYARYLALHPPMQFYGHAEKVVDRAKDQIEYPDEDPFIRQTFEDELGKRGIRSAMPDECYRDPDYEWSPSVAR